MNVPEFISVGYVTVDLLNGRKQPGGSSYYSAMTARKLGKKAAVWTSAASGDVKDLHRAGIEVALSPSEKTTTFLHEYGPGGTRKHRCEIVADGIEAATLPDGWSAAPMVVLCPNGEEIDPDHFMLFESEWIAFLPQGWFRRFHRDGHVTFDKSKWHALPKHVGLVVVSDDDLVHDREAWEWLKKYAQVAVRTHGRRGHIVAFNNTEREFPPPHVSEDVDPTGAGDVFAAAMLIALSEGAEPIEAANFGSVAASYAVEKPGVEGLPTRGEITERLRSRRAP